MRSSTCALIVAVLVAAGICRGQPCEIDRIGSYGGAARSVAIADSIAYVAQDVGGLYLYDLSDPSAPSLLGKVELEGAAMGLALVGDIAFVAAAHGGLYAVDVSEPESPAILGSFQTPGTAHDVAVLDSVAYVADTDGGFFVIDASDPTDLRGLGSAPDAGWAVDVAVDGAIACIASETFGLVLVDVSDPSAPTELSRYWTGRGLSVAMDGSLAWLGTGLELHAIDIADPAAPAMLSRTYIGGDVVGLSQRGHLLYIASESEGLIVFDVSAPSAPVKVGSCFCHGLIRGLGMEGSLACLAKDDHGIVLIDVENPADPAEIAAHPTLARSAAVATGGSTAYVADRAFASLDVSDPSRPRLLGWLDVGELLSTVHLAGDLAVALSGSRMYLISVEEPAAPALLGVFEASGGLDAVRIVDDVALLTGNHGLMCVDISEPSAPAQLGLMRLPRGTAGFDVTGELAVVANDTRLYLIDFSDPWAPVEDASLHSGARGLTAVTTEGDYSYFAAGRWGMAIVDTGARPPRLLATLELGDDARDVVLGAGVAWFADGADGVAAVDISQPHAPQRIGGFNTPGQARGMAMPDDLLYVADSTGGLQILDAGNCRACLADCDDDGQLTFFDFLCFADRFSESQPWADCDGSGVFDLFDFLCFQNAFAAGCR